MNYLLNSELKMARQGAALQNYNNELVKSLEELCQRRHTLQVDRGDPDAH